MLINPHHRRYPNDHQFLNYKTFASRPTRFTACGGQSKTHNDLKGGRNRLSHLGHCSSVVFMMIKAITAAMRRDHQYCPKVGNTIFDSVYVKDYLGA